MTGREDVVPSSIWEPHLTELDRRVQESFPKRELMEPGRRAAVLSVDNYRGGLGDTPESLPDALIRWPSSTGLAGWRGVAQVARLLERARELGVPVVHTTGMPGRKSGLPTWRPAKGGRRGMSEATEVGALDDDVRYEFVELAAPLPGEIVIRKSAPSAFFGTTLESLLRTLEIDTVIVCGTATSGCVRATVVDAASHRLRVIVPAEATYDRTEVSHAINLFDMHEKYADVLTLDVVLDRLPALAQATPTGVTG